MTQTNAKDGFTEIANERLKTMTADELADLLRYNDALETQANTPEAVGSCTTKIIGPGGAEVMVTSRGVSLESAWAHLEHFVKMRLAEGYRPLTNQPKSEMPVTNSDHTASSSNQPARTNQPAPTARSQAPAQSQGELTFRASTLEGSITGGKTYWKVKGGQYSLHGVTIWPEVLEAAGFDMNQLDAREVYDLSNFTAVYVLNDKNNPSKVVELRS